MFNCANTAPVHDVARKLMPLPVPGHGALAENGCDLMSRLRPSQVTGLVAELTYWLVSPHRRRLAHTRTGSSQYKRASPGRVLHKATVCCRSP